MLKKTEEYKAVFKHLEIPQDLAEAKTSSILRILDNALRKNAGLQGRAEPHKLGSVGRYDSIPSSSPTPATNKYQ